MPLSRLLKFLFTVWLAASCLANTALANMREEIDLIIVNKTERQLHLLQGDEIVRTYPISLGKNPIGHKTHEGDQRTPEGRYLIDWRNPESRYHLALHISYPSPQDLQKAEQHGVNPGGSIMIHGLPKKFSDGANVLLDLDWTDGCIALSNNHMEEVWNLVADNTVIEILP
ncbi:MAG: L,D-transpeptidase family protein [Deltaproteobacteria bacterium]|jgi:murein L,D-transpeptidase YafK|nr:L,D-transpeptidase family protein [Deltaproteobacteria bacterium]MBW2504916.1 L,D-transpeptidase family protein [Deltaproteobacteria bacterium]